MHDLLKNPHYDLVPKDFDANVEFRIDMLKMCASDKAAAAQVKTMCGEDLLFYVNAFCWTFDPRQSHVRDIPFITYEGFQDDGMMTMADAILTGFDAAVPKSRCMGASWMGLTVFEWFWHFQRSMQFGLISRNEDYVDKKGNPKSLFWKIDYLHCNQPKWLLPAGRHLGWSDPQRKLLVLGNSETGSTITGESTTGDMFRGDRLTAMFWDETAACEINDGFRGLKSTRDTTKCRIFNSTPQGDNNAFAEVVKKTSARHIRLHWTSHPTYRQGLYTMDDLGKVKLLDDWTGDVEVCEKGQQEPRTYRFPEDYPFQPCSKFKMRSPWFDNECNRCVTEMEIAQELEIDFLGSDYQFFDSETIAALTQQYVKPAMLVGDIEFDPETLTPKRFVANSHGKLQLWMNVPEGATEAHSGKFALGADVSAGTGASNSVCTVANVNTGEKVAVWRDPKTRPTEFADICMVIGKFFRDALLNYDASGAVGKTFTMRVNDKGYGNLYYRRDEERAGAKASEKPGYALTPTSKTVLMQDYRSALDTHRFINHSMTGLQECLQFIVCPGNVVEHSAAMNSQDPSGARTAHGDEAVADAIASRGCKSELSTTKEKEVDEPPEGSLAYRRKQKELSDRPKGDSLGDGW